MDSCCGILIQWQKTCSNRKDTIWVKLWKTSMERWPCGTIGDSKSRKVSCRATEELGTGYKDNGRSIEEYEKTIRQEKVKFSRTEGWRQCVAKNKISNQIDPQRSWTIKDMDLLGSWRILAQERFNWNFWKDGLFTTCLMKTFWHDVWSQSSRVSTRNWYHHQWLSIKKRNTMLRKLGSIGNGVERHNILCTGKDMEMNMINRSQK